MKENQAHNISAIYGNTMFCLSQNHSKIPHIKSNPAYRMPFCHQSVFVKTSLLKKYHFDTSFKICADNAFFTKIYNQGSRFYYVDMIVSVYNIYGISSKPSWQFFKEELRIISAHNPYHIPIFICKYALCLIKYTIKMLLPTVISHKIQSIYNAK